MDSKRHEWEDLFEVNSNPWDLGYRVVMRRSGTRTIAPILDAQRLRIMIDALFPNHSVKAQISPPVVPDYVALFSKDELKEATSFMQSDKAPGSDNVPSEVLKVIGSSCPGTP